MRRARITYEGAIHHAMNRGYNGLPIFIEDIEKEKLLELIKKNLEKTKVSILAFCIMNNHYHLIVQNSSGRMPDFFRRLNGEFANFYRRKNGGKGYVFQDRYKSILIQDDSYLLLVIAYVLNNPVRKGITKNFLNYEWSSGSKYFNNNFEFIDTAFIRDSFPSKRAFSNFINGTDIKELPTIKTETGNIIGGEEFYIKSLKKFDRRNNDKSIGYMRVEDHYFEPVEKIFYEFEKKYGVNPDKLETNTIKGKRLRSKLLINLKNRGGMTYKEINKLDAFSELKFNSLGKIYRDALKGNKIK